MKNKLKKIFRKIFGKNIVKIKKIIDKNEFQIISFDIFDTLIFRDTGKPESIFALVNDRIRQMNIGLNNFVRIRIEVEKYLRKRKYPYEITIDDIYDEIRIQNNLSAETAELIKEIEIQEECDHCVAQDNGLLEIYNIMCNLGVKVILTSDMYLPIDVIKKILKKNKICNYSRIFLSSQCKNTKKSGLLFQHILLQEQIEAKKVIHIGDNPLGDYLRARQYGLRAVLWK